MLKKIVRASLITVITTLFICLFGQVRVFAESGFSYKVEFPDNQMEKEIGYYHLKMKPGQEQTLLIRMANSSDKKTKVNVSLNSAKTNSNGVIEYGENAIKEDKSLKFSFKDIAKAPNKVELAAGQQKNFEIKLKMPETSYPGVIVGGIQMIEENQGEEEKAEGAMVINEYAHAIAVLLQEEDIVVKPELKLNSIKAGQANLKNTIFVNYSNVEAAFLNDMTTEVQINKKGNETVLYEKKQSKMRMAPNTQITFPVDMNGEAMVAGDYTAKILVTGADGLRYEWTKDFKITTEEADKYNERDVGLVQKTGFDWKLIVMIILGAFVLIGIIFTIIYFVRKNNDKKSKSKKKGKNSKKK